MYNHGYSYWPTIQYGTMRLHNKMLEAVDSELRFAVVISVAIACKFSRRDEKGSALLRMENWKSSRAVFLPAHCYSFYTRSESLTHCWLVIQHAANDSRDTWAFSPLTTDVSLHAVHSRRVVASCLFANLFVHEKLTHDSTVGMVLDLDGRERERNGGYSMMWLNTRTETESHRKKCVV